MFLHRGDGTFLRHTDPMYRIASHVMVRRSDSTNSITLDIPVAPIDGYLRQKKRDGHPVSHMAVILAAYIRTLAEYPALNRFILNKRAYSRNEIAIGMVVLRAGGTQGKSNDGTMSKVYFNPTDDVFQVEKTVQEYIARNREQKPDNPTEKIINVLIGLPGLMRAVVVILKWMDKHNMMPKKIIDASPFHTTMVFSNLASIRTNYIHHHCYDFGTTSMIMTAGNSREVAVRKGGEIVYEKCMPLGVVMDERICSGSYYAMAFRRMNHFLAHPEELETPITQVLPDPEL